MENFQKWNPKKDSTGRVLLLEMGVPFPVLVNCAVGYLHDDQVIFYGKLAECGHLEVKTFHLVSLILSL